MSVVSFSNVSFAYESWPVLEAVTFSVEAHEFFAIIGPNGGGKTTILRLISGLIRPQSGTVTVLGAPAGKQTRRIGYVPQTAVVERDFPITVEAVVLLGRLYRFSFTPFFSPADEKAAAKAMDSVGIYDLRHRRFEELSGGQKQRVLIARALVSEPELLLLDEPVSSVDSEVEQDIYALLKELNKKITIIMVSHDLGFVSSYVSRVACVNRFLTIEQPTAMTQKSIDEKYHSHMHMVGHHCGL